LIGLAIQAQSGKGTIQDYNETARLLSIAASRGEPRAYAVLAFLYLEDGKPFPRDPVMARQLAEKGAAEGDTAARALLGAMLREGIGGASDKNRSFALLSLSAADNKMASYAQYQLGLSYEVGAGTPVSKDKAIELYKLAASHDFAPAIKRLTVLGVVTAQPLPPAQADDDNDEDHACGAARTFCRNGMYMCDQYRSEFLKSGRVCHGVTDSPAR
jgi:TPR repeat protein